MKRGHENIIIIIIKHLCYHTICQMNAIPIAMQAMNHGRRKLSHDQSGQASLKMDVFRSFLKIENVFAIRHSRGNSKQIEQLD